MGILMIFNPGAGSTISRKEETMNNNDFLRETALNDSEYYDEFELLTIKETSLDEGRKIGNGIIW